MESRETRVIDIHELQSKNLSSPIEYLGSHLSSHKMQFIIYVYLFVHICILDMLM